MTVASKMYPAGLKYLTDGTTVFLSDTVKIMLLTASATYNSAHDHVDDINANEIPSAGGYTGGFAGAGRKTLAGKAISINGTHIELDASDITWTALNDGTVGAAAIIEEITNDAGSALIAFIDFTDLATNGGDVTLVVNSGGFMQIDAP